MPSIEAESLKEEEGWVQTGPRCRGKPPREVILSREEGA